MSEKVVYLDNNATSQVAPEVVEAMMPFFGPLYGNPSSMHAFGGNVAKFLQKAREDVAAFLNASPEEIIFTGCATESDNAAIRGSAEFFGREMKIITTKVEHPAVLQPCRRLKREGFDVVELGVNGVGQIDLEELRKELSQNKKALVSAMWANNETGTVFPIAQIAEICREFGAVFHTDAVQAAGKIAIDVKKIPLDMLSISGHKFHAPKGIGILYVRRGTRLKPFMLGGHQESGRRAGTENVPYIVGFAKACELASESLAQGEAPRLAAMRDRLQAGLLAKCPDAIVNGDIENRLSNTLNISFKYIEGEAIAYHLSDLGICVSTGSACASGSLEPSHVIRAMGVPFTAVHGSVRFSLSRYNTDEDIDIALEKIPPVIKRLRDLSPFGPDSDPTTFS
ncbi:MAG: cysteine desulfurase NifS [Kiritimatiellae bacterium]|nr:cysteine desulfurase NifS [Kiritimatiellia bacterium]